VTDMYIGTTVRCYGTNTDQGEERSG